MKKISIKNITLTLMLLLCGTIYQQTLSAKKCITKEIDKKTDKIGRCMCTDCVNKRFWWRAKRLWTRTAPLTLHDKWKIDVEIMHGKQNLPAAKPKDSRTSRLAKIWHYIKEKLS